MVGYDQVKNNSDDGLCCHHCRRTKECKGAPCAQKLTNVRGKKRKHLEECTGSVIPQNGDKGWGQDNLNKKIVESTWDVKPEDHDGGWGGAKSVEGQGINGGWHQEVRTSSTWTAESKDGDHGRSQTAKSALTCPVEKDGDGGGWGVGEEERTYYW